MVNKNKKKSRSKERAEPKMNQRAAFLDFGIVSDICDVKGYNSLADTPEIKGGVEKIAEIISTMTIHLMENGELGDIRIKDELAKKIDVNPNKKMTRQLFISWIVQEMLLNGNAIVKPKTSNGMLEDLEPIPNKLYNFIKNEKDYLIQMNNGAIVESEEVLHFRYNPDINNPMIGQSQDIILASLIDDLKQANATVSGFMKSKMLPSLIVKVDALTEELTTKEGRDKVEQQFIDRSEAGKPWIIPAGLIDVKEVKPLTLNDIAIHESIKINKKTVASILGIPAFLLGVGEYNKEEYNNFIRTKIAVVCKAIEQELTNKLLISPYRYFQFNRKSMLNYDLKELGDLYRELLKVGVVSGNEVRDVLGMSPREELDQLVILENYIPKDKIGNQSKLGGDE